MEQAADIHVHATFCGVNALKKTFHIQSLASFLLETDQLSEANFGKKQWSMYAVLLIIGLCINTGKQIDHPSQRTIVVGCLDETNSHLDEVQHNNYCSF